jgi:hypothetical protein
MILENEALGLVFCKLSDCLFEIDEVGLIGLIENGQRLGAPQASANRL